MPVKTKKIESDAVPTVRFDKKLGINVGHFYEEVYEVHVYLVWPAGPKETQAFLRDVLGHEMEEYEQFGGLFIPVEDSGAGVIALPSFTFTPSSIGALSHEVVHLKDWIFKIIEHAPALENNETEAYLTGSLMRRCMQLLSA